MINKRQYIILSFFLSRVMFMGGGFSLLVGLSKNNLLIASILGAILGCILLYFIFKKGFVNKYLCIVICITILIVNILANNILTGTFLLYNTPTIIIMAVFMALLIYGAKKELKDIARVAEICIICSLFIFFLAYLGLIPLVKLENLLPLFNSSVMNFFKGIIVFAGASLVPNLLLINFKEELKFKQVCVGYVLGCITVIGIMFYILGIYGSQFASIVRVPEYLILKKIDILNYVSNIENILIMEWIINITISGLFCTKVLHKYTNKYVFIILMLCLFIGIEFLLNRMYVNVLFIKNNIYYFCFILVILCFIIKKNKTT